SGELRSVALYPAAPAGGGVGNHTVPIGHFRGRPAGALRWGNSEPVRLRAVEQHIGEREQIRGPFQQLVAELAPGDVVPQRPHRRGPGRRVDGAHLSVHCHIPHHYGSGCSCVTDAFDTLFENLVEGLVSGLVPLLLQEGLREGDERAGVTFSVAQVGRTVGVAVEDEEVLAVDNPTETRRCPCKQASGCRGRGSSARSAPRASSALRRRAHARPPSRKYLLIANLAVLAPYRRDFTTWRLHEGLHTHRTMWIVQVHLIEEAPLYGAFAEPSDGLEPSTPSLPW